MSNFFLFFFFNNNNNNHELGRLNSFDELGVIISRCHYSTKSSLTLERIIFTLLTGLRFFFLAKNLRDTNFFYSNLMLNSIIGSVIKKKTNETKNENQKDKKKKKQVAWLASVS